MDKCQSSLLFVVMSVAGLKELQCLREALISILPGPRTEQVRIIFYPIQERCWVILVDHSLRDADQSLNKRIKGSSSSELAETF